MHGYENMATEGTENITGKVQDLRVIVYRKWVRAAANYLQTLLYFEGDTVHYTHT